MLYTPLNDQVFLQIVPPPPGSLKMPPGVSYARVLSLAPRATFSGLKKGDFVVVRFSGVFDDYIAVSYLDCLLHVENKTNGNA